MFRLQYAPKANNGSKSKTEKTRIDFLLTDPLNSFLLTGAKMNFISCRLKCISIVENVIELNSIFGMHSIEVIEVI